jgi:hypothetical protein
MWKSEKNDGNSDIALSCLGKFFAKHTQSTERCVHKDFTYAGLEMVGFIMLRLQFSVFGEGEIMVNENNFLFDRKSLFNF